MNINIEIIYKLLVVLIGFYFFYKFIIPLIVQYLAKKNDQRNNASKTLDQLIREKELLLRKNRSNQAESKGSLKRNDRKFSLEDLIKEYEEKSNQKEVIEVLESLQWGDSSFIRETIEDTRNKFSLTLTNAHISRAIIENVDTPFFRALPDLKKIKDFCVSFSIIKSLMNKSEASQHAISIAKNTAFLSEKDIITGSHLFFIKNDIGKEFSEKNYDNILKYESPVFKKSTDSKEKSLYNSVFLLGKNHPLAANLLIEKIISESLIVMAITPVNINKKPSIEEALNFFNLPDASKSNLKQLKKNYKKLAQICHPDKLSGAKVPSNYMSIANENFVKIKNIYEMIKKETK